MGVYRKFLFPVVATILAGLIPALGDNALSVSELINIGILAVGAVNVLGARNEYAGFWRYAKSVFAGLSAVLVLASSLISDGLTNAEIIQMIVAFASALGVVAVPNAREAAIGDPGDGSTPLSAT